MTTPVDELRKAVEILRCDHRFPINPPKGFIGHPGSCIHCGVSYQFEKPVADWMVELLAEQLEIYTYAFETGVISLPGDRQALAVARAIRGGDGS